MPYDEELEALFSPLTVSEALWDAADDDVAAIVERTQIQPGSRVLVLPRGTGQHAVAFARAGFEVTAVGPDDDALLLARERAMDEGCAVHFVVADPEEFRPEGGFDLVLNLSSSFDFIQGGTGNGVLAALRRALEPDGWAVLRMVNLASSQRRVDVRDWREGPQGLLVLEELENDWEKGWVCYRWLVVTRDGERFEFQLGHRGYDAQWLQETLREAGFDVVELVGSLDGEPFTAKTPVVLYARV